MMSEHNRQYWCKSNNNIKLNRFFLHCANNHIFPINNIQLFFRLFTLKNVAPPKTCQKCIYFKANFFS